MLPNVHAQVAALLRLVRAMRALVRRLLAPALYVLVATQRRLPPILLATVAALVVLVRVVDAHLTVLHLVRVLALDVAAVHAVHRARLRVPAPVNRVVRRLRIRIQLNLVDRVVRQLADDARLQLLVRDPRRLRLGLDRLLDVDLLDDRRWLGLVLHYGYSRARGGEDIAGALAVVKSGREVGGVVQGGRRQLVAKLAGQREVQQFGLLIVIADRERHGRDGRHQRGHRVSCGRGKRLASHVRLLDRILDARMVLGRLLGHSDPS